MLMIRLKRVGRRNDPSFRIVVTEKSQSPTSGKYVEQVGTYNPHEDIRKVNAERIKYWISQGAQPSDTVHNLLISEGVIEGEKINVLPQKSPVVKEEKEEAPAEDTADAEADEASQEDTTEDTEETEKSEEGGKEEESEEGDAEESTDDSSDEESQETEDTSDEKENEEEKKEE